MRNSVHLLIPNAVFCENSTVETIILHGDWQNKTYWGNRTWIRICIYSGCLLDLHGIKISLFAHCSLIDPYQSSINIYTISLCQRQRLLVVKPALLSIKPTSQLPALAFLRTTNLLCFLYSMPIIWIFGKAQFKDSCWRKFSLLKE